MSSNSRPPASRIDTIAPPFETEELRAGLKAFLGQPVSDPKNPKVKRIGGYTFGVYAFYDYDDEPIYVGQTKESISGRIGRHLTNQRTDAVAMNVLDPYEVCHVSIWPVPDFQGLDKKAKKDPAVIRHMDDLEASVFHKLLSESKFSAVLNEKIPLTSNKAFSLPHSYKGCIVSDKVKDLRGHPDMRLARRAATIARLAQVISEREVHAGLRRTLLIQAKRLQWLAEQRYKPFETEAKFEDAKAGGEE